MSVQSLQTALREQGYVQTAQFSFLELINVVRSGFASRNRFIMSYWALLLASLLAPAAAGWWWVRAGAVTLSDYMAWAFSGVLITFLLVPLHEGIHGWCFRYYGARQVRYGVVLKYLMFYAVAHLFVVNYRQYRLIALAPFVVISILCIAAAVWLPHPFKAAALGALFFHTFCCAGDFGLCAYMYLYRNRDVVSFDDADTRSTWFFCKG
jgi:hypothetical protein